MKLQNLLIFLTLLTGMFPGCGILYASDGIWISRLGVEHGLSNNHVVGIVQDIQGFIWVATDEGLNRYDGHSFRTYLKDELTNADGITGNELSCIMYDSRRNVVWIATQRAGLDVYDCETDSFSSFRHIEGDDNTLAADDITSVAPAGDGGIWIATYWRGIDHLDPESGKIDHYNPSTVKGMPDESIWRVLDGGDGFLYVAHEHHGLTIVDIGKKTARHFMPQPGVAGSLPTADLQCVYKDSLDNIWIGGESGLTLFNRDEETFTDYGKWHPELRHPVADIKQFDGNRLWIAMERGGVATIELDGNLFSSPDMAHCSTIGAGSGVGLLSSPSVRCLFKDNYSNIWVGSWGGGINLLRNDRPPFSLHPGSPTFPHGEVSSASSVFSLLFDDSGCLWVGKDGGGLDVFDNDRKIASYSSSDGLPGDIVQSAWKAPDGRMWFGCFNAGAAVYDTLSKRFERVFPEGSKVDVRDIFGMGDGRIAFASSQGVWIYDAALRTMDGPVMIGDNLIRKIFPVSDDTVLVGTFGSGLWIADKDFNVKGCLDVSCGLPSNTVNDIFQGRSGTIWVATGEGLLKFDDIVRTPEKFEVINRASGLLNSHVQAITQDRSGNIWVSTNGGISCVMYDMMTSAPPTIYNYTHRDHVPIGSFLTHCVTSDRQGNLYFGAISGICEFNPVKVLEKIPSAPAVITELSVMNPPGSKSSGRSVVQLHGKERVRLNPGQNSFDVYFTTGNFAIAGEVEYAYMLEGIDKSWIPVDHGNVASFHDLPSGTYRFLVKNRLRNQEWGSPSQIVIELPPPVWLSWWAKTLYVLASLALVGSLLYLYRRRVNAEAQLRTEKERHLRQQELNDERLRFYTNITHELRTPLTLISGPLEDLSRTGNLPEKDRRSVEMVHRNAIRLLDLVNRILEFRKTETQNRRLCVCHGNISGAVYEVALKYKELNRNPEVKVNVAAHAGDADVLFDKEVVTVVLDNLISNALKYTQKGTVDVDCNVEGENVVLKVSDTGVGISPDAIPHIFERYYQEGGVHQMAGTGIGLSLVRNLVALHHGRISVESELGKGTVFTVFLPIEDSYPEALHTEENAVTREDAERDEASNVGNDRPVVLLVEDNEDIRDYIKQSFTDLYDVYCASNGEEGLRIAFENIPAVVVSDIMMPVMDGIEMTRRLKGDVRTSHIPVILLTAKVNDGDRAEGYECGADSYLTKPFSASLLQTRINNLLYQRMKLVESFSSNSEPSRGQETESESAETVEKDSMREKRERLMKGLGDIDREFIEKLDKIISESLPSENVDVNYLSGVLCMSTSTLYRKVKAVTGLSPNEYIRKTKMHIAESLIIDGHYTMSEISYKVGINSQAYFRQCFKEEFGVLPSEYLRNIKHSRHES